MTSVTAAAAIVTFERRNEYTMSLSSIARSREGLLRRDGVAGFGASSHATFVSMRMRGSTTA